MNKLSLKGILVGIVLVVALDTIAGVVMMSLMGSLKGGMTQQHIGASVSALTHSTSFLLWSAILGTLVTIAGGYVAARVAKRHVYLNAGAIGVLGIVLGVLFSGDYPLWFNVFSFLSVLPAALLGGHFAKSPIEGHAGNPINAR